jgi:phospholipase/carboxylesterase
MTGDADDDDDPHARAAIVRCGPRPADAALAVIALHGRDLGAESALDHVARLALPEVAFVVPEADRRSWYPASFLAPLADNQPRLDRALARVDALVAELIAAGAAAERVVVLGFSQGACLALEWLARRAPRIGGLVAFTGGLIGPPGTRWASAPALAVPVLITTSDIDAWVPLARVRETAAALRARGAPVELRVLAGRAHLVDDLEIAAARAFLGGLGAA